MSQTVEQARQRALAVIANSQDPKKLRVLAENAARAGDSDVEQSARRKLYSILPAAQSGTLEHDVWSSIFALEDALAQERGKTVRLSRTRQKIARDGEQQTVEALVAGKETSGFQMLIERGMADLTFEAVAIRHAARFNAELLEEARLKLKRAGAEEAS